jgi:hypothetical protein
MKKFIYLSIVIATISFSSFRSQDEIVLSKNIKNIKVSVEPVETTATKYATFDSSVSEIGTPENPTKD